MPAPPTARLLLLRHAETAAPDRFHGLESDIGLGEQGREQAEAAAPALAALGLAAVYGSAMARAMQTAAPIARLAGLEPIPVPELHERRMGSLSGRVMDEVREVYHASKDRWKLGDLEATHDGGESFAAIRDRVVPAFRRLADRHMGQTIAVVAHGMVIRVLLATLLEGHGPADFDGFGIDFVAVNDLRFDGETWTARLLNGKPARPGPAT